jgi:hypothetical protein
MEKSMSLGVKGVVFEELLWDDYSGVGDNKAKSVKV